MQTTIPISGMRCASCAVAIEQALKKTPGVSEARVNFALNRAIIKHDDSVADLTKIKEAIRKTGYEVSQESRAASNKKPSSRQVGKLTGSITHRAHGLHDQKSDTPTSNPSSALETGSTAQRTHQHTHGATRPREAIIALSLAALLISTMVWAPNLGSIEEKSVIDIAILAVGWILVAVFGRRFHASAIRAIRRGRANMDTLVSLGSLAAIGWSTYAFFAGGVLYAEVAGTIIAFILLGKTLEDRARTKTAAAVESLFALHPKTTHRLRPDGSMEDADPLALKLGDRCLVKPGEQIPTDGIITEGETTVDESMLTGEPVAVNKGKGDAVTGGTMNGAGSLTISVTAVAGQTVLDAIVRTVERALISKSPVERLADRISAIFVPSVIGIAIVTLAAWLMGDATTGDAVRYAVAVLIVACPCALGLATPAAMAVGVGLGAKRGILVKEPAALESARAVTTVVFDKTGTLTEGRPSVSDVVGRAESGADRIELLRVAASLERPSEHPFAAAILRYVDASAATNTRPERVTAFHATAGQGVEGVLDGVPVALGTEAFVAGRGVRIPKDLRATVNRLRDEAKTVIFVSRGSELIGALAAEDRVRPESAAAVADLQKQGLRVALMTGDHLASASAVAKTLGITEIYADVSPVKKGEIVTALQRNGAIVAFVGDGMNDAPALAHADLGIAIGTGTDIAIATGDLVLMNGSPAKTIEALALAKTTFRAIRQNLFWAFIYNLVGIPLAAFGYLNPMIAAFAMAFSSVSVLGNSLRIAKSSS